MVCKSRVRDCAGLGHVQPPRPRGSEACGHVPCEFEQHSESDKLFRCITGGFVHQPVSGLVERRCVLAFTSTGRQNNWYRAEGNVFTSIKYTGDSSQSGVPTSGPHDFSEYLQQMKAWELVMGEPDPFSSDTPQSSNTSPLRLVSRSRKRESEPGAPDVRSVPSIFFQDSFDVEDSATFHAACPIGDLNEAERIHNLEGHLDKVQSLLEPF